MAFGNATRWASIGYAACDGTPFDMGAGSWSFRIRTKMFDKSPGANPESVLFSHKSTGLLEGYALYYESSLDELTLLLGDGTVTIPVTAPGSSISTLSSVWEDIVGTIDRGTDLAKLYVDGAEVASVSIFTLGSITNNGSLRVAAFHDSADRLSADIDELSLWPGRVLNPAEVLALNANETSLSDSKIIGLWSMDTGSGTALFHQSNYPIGSVAPMASRVISGGRARFGDILDPGNSDYVAEIIVSIADTGPDQVIMSRGNAAINWDFRFLTGPKQLRFSVRSSNFVFTDYTPEDIAIPHRYSCVIDRTADTIRIYEDGLPVGTPSDISFVGSLAVSEPLTVGDESFFDSGRVMLQGGMVSDFRIWSALRSDYFSDHDKRLLGTETDLVGYWTMNDGSGTVIADSIPSGTADGAESTAVIDSSFLSFTALALIVIVSPMSLASCSIVRCRYEPFRAHE